MSQIILTKKQAREFILYHQGLLIPRTLNGKNDILDFIKKVACIQFDPLDRVGYNSHLVLQSRVKNYTKNHLSELLYKDRKLLDGWDKNMSIYPVEDRLFFKKYHEIAYNKYSNKDDSINEVIPEIKDIINNKGPISSIDLDFDKKVNWSWAPTRVARAALERMYNWGELIIHHKIGTRKVYDFAHKHLPSDILNTDYPHESDIEEYKWFVKRRIDSLGMLWSLSGGAWLGRRKIKKKQRTEAIKQLRKNNKLLKIRVKGIKHPLFVNVNKDNFLDKVRKGLNYTPEVSFIAPLDNLMWDRKLIKRIFNFDYVWEVYKPVEKREYGYYVLPVLYGDKFVARFEPIYNKKSNVLTVKNWWWEDKEIKTNSFKKSFKKALEDFSNYLSAESIKIKDSKIKKLI